MDEIDESELHWQNEANVQSFPDDLQLVGIEMEYRETDLPCAICKGVRKAVSNVFTIHFEKIIAFGEELTWEECQRKHPDLARALFEELRMDRFDFPTCKECQKDFYIDGKHTYKKVK